ncbi:MAG: coproporphyrinogen dehydrogenase HemZ [Clostridia bacterium]|nr:coproporphyrinogen dehydrogenase HemZ [Clostridia bacterium]
MISLVTNDEKLYDELLLIVKLFYDESSIQSLNLEIDHNCSINDDIITNSVKISGLFDNKHTRTDKLLEFMQKDKKYKYLKRFAKLTLYETLSLSLNKTLPWGALTGIRPAKLLSELQAEEGSLIKATNRLINEFYVSKDKANIAKQIILNQGGITKNDKLVDFYVHIPFCPTRCNYCSFISNGLDMCNHLLEPYLDALIYDIIKTKEMLSKNNYLVKTVYIGGGTPTVLSPEQLDRLLSAIGYKVSEFTVESGRPDTITKEKLDVMKKHGVSRICINPQTFSNRTLKNIVRNHTAEQVIDAYKLALPYNFDINMDLIAGLDGESLATFKKSLNTTIEMHPTNITVHTLSIKRASRLHEFGGEISSVEDTAKMVNYATKKLYENGYKPYYLYRQKNMVGNLENIGYFRDGKVNVFNIDSMEDIASIVACGAGAVSKRYYSSLDRIERFGELKNIKEYCSRIDEMIEKKTDLFS